MNKYQFSACIRSSLCSGNLCFKNTLVCLPPSPQTQKKESKEIFLVLPSSKEKDKVVQFFIWPTKRSVYPLPP